MRPMCELPYCASGISASLAIAHGMLVAHRSSSPRWRYTNWCRSSRYCSSSQLCVNAGVTSSISDSEKSVVMCSLVSADPSAAGCGACARWPSGVTRSDSFSTPLRPPCRTCGSPLLTREARRRSKTRSMAALLMGFASKPLPAHAARQHLVEHPEVRAEAVERMGEGRGPVLLEEAVPHPREGVARHRHRPEQRQAPAQERGGRERERQQRAAHVQAARRAVAVLAEIER